MRKTIAIAIFALAAVGTALSAQTTFDRAVDFSVGIEDIAVLVSRGEEAKLDTGKSYILDGAIASIDVYQPDEANFLALLEVVSGEWIGLERVAMYRVFVVVSGPDYFKRIPQRVAPNAPPDTIENNSRVIVVGSFADVGEMPDGTRVGILNGDHVRVIK